MASPSTSPPRQAQHARVAVAAVFLTNGALFANVVPRYPELKDELDLSNAALGAVVAGQPIGALLAGLLATAAIRYFGSASVAAMGVILHAATILLIPTVSTGFALAAVLVVIGALDALIDVGQNAHGLRVQRRYGRSIVNSFHGLWSIGAVLGGLMGSAAAGLKLPLALHLGCASGLFALVALVAYRFMLPGPEDAERTEEATSEHSSAKPARSWFASRSVWVLAALGLISISGAFVEDAGASWGAIYLTNSLHATAATAGLAFVALQGAMTIGRLTGDRFIDRFGSRNVVRGGGVLIAVGMALALGLPSVGTTLAGYALAGLGVATFVPATMHAADELPGLPRGAGLTIVSWLLRVGFVISPPVVGLIADLTSLRIGLLTVVLAGILAVIFGRVMAGRVIE